MSSEKAAPLGDVAVGKAAPPGDLTTTTATTTNVMTTTTRPVVALASPLWVVICGASNPVT
jgi:hypothetical protein